MLEMLDVDAYYGNVQTLRAVSLHVQPGEILCLMGRNGAGKTTTLKSIMGLVRPHRGYVSLNGQVISDLSAHDIPKKGIGYVPQGRRLFAELTVAENIEIGLLARRRGAQTRDNVFDLFPRLRERQKQVAGTLSGGEQQMLAMARAFCLEPSVLLLDEPTEGLQPSMIELIRNVALEMRDQGVAILLVEQRADAVLSMADRVSFLVRGQVLETVDIETLKTDPKLLHTYVGV